MTTSAKRVLAGAIAAGVLILPAAACGEDEDGDGGTTDEEVQDLEDTVSSLEQRVEDEIDAQDTGTNENDESGGG
jgi:hypothetical protein